MYYTNWKDIIKWSFIPEWFYAISNDEYIKYYNNIINTSIEHNKRTTEEQKKLLEEKKAKLVESLKSGDFSTVADLLLG